MHRRQFIQSMTMTGIGAALPWQLLYAKEQRQQAVSVTALSPMIGELTLYLGRGEGGLYEDVLGAITKRNPELKLNIRRGATAALANTLIAEAKAGVKRADLFWAVDTGAIALMQDAGLAKPLPANISSFLKPGFQYSHWTPISGRIRTLPYHTGHIDPSQIPDDVMALADSDLKIGWAPAYASFQSFITAMRLLEGEQTTVDWLKGVSKHAKPYAGELGVVMGVERGEVDIGFANHYYTLRLKSGKPDAQVALAFSKNDAGCLVNASGIVALSDGDLPQQFIRYLLTKEVQSYLSSEAYEIPLVNGVAEPEGLLPISKLSPPQVDLQQLADIRPTLQLMRKAGVL